MSTPETEVGKAEVPPASADGFPCFDGLRALAAIAVLVCHTAQASTAIQSAAGPYLYELRVGVEVFFTMSGFLIYRPFAVAHLTGRPSPLLGGYFRRRLLRIYPAYWVALTVSVVVLGIGTFSSFRGALTNYALVQTYDWPRSVGPQGIVIAWTLVIELTFYVVLPVYAAAVRRAARQHRLRTEVIGAVILFGTGVVFAAVWSFSADPSGPLRYSLLANLSPFAVGILLAVASADAEARGQARRWVQGLGRSPASWWALAAIAWSATIWLVHVPVVPKPGQVPTGKQLFAETLLFTVVGMAMVVPAVVGDQRRGTIRRILRLRPVMYLGVVSYGIYLWHFTIARELVDRFDLDRSSTNFFVITGATLALSVVVASASWFILERPILALARRGFGRGVSAGVPSEAVGPSSAQGGR